MQIAYTLTFLEFLEGQRVHENRSAKARVLRFLNWWFFPVLGLVLVLGSIVLWREGSPWLTVIVVFLYGLFLVCYRLLLLGRAKSKYTNTRRGDGSVLIQLEEDEIVAEWPECARSVAQWTAIKKFREDEKVLLIYVAPAIFFIVPKRALSPEQLSELLFLLNRKLVLRG
jgi:YcxB-like protein